MRRSNRQPRARRRLSPYFLKRLSSWLVLSTALAISTAVVSQAATLTWDPNANGGATGGSGNWQDATGPWFNGGAATWNNATPDSAIFGGTGGGPFSVTVDVTGITAAALTFSSAGYTIAGPGTLTLSGVSTITTTSDATISAVIADTAGSGLLKAGAGVLTLSGANTYSGITQITNGTLKIGAANNLGDSSLTNTISIANGAKLLDTGAAVDLGVNRAIAVGAGGGAIAATTGNTLTVSGAISGSGNLSFTNGGTVVLSADNSLYAGNVTVSSLAGDTTNTTLRLSNSNALTSGTVTVNTGLAVAGGTGNVLDLAGVTISGVNLVLNAAAAGNARSSLLASTGFNTWNGNISMVGDGSTGLNTGTGAFLTVGGNITDGGYTGSFFVRGVGNGTINGTISLPTGNLVKTDTGSWTIGAAGNSWANTQVSVGTLTMGAIGALPSGTIVTMGQNDANTATLDLNGFDQTIAGLTSNPTTGTNANSKTITSSFGATLTINQSTNTTYGSVLSGFLSIVKQGGGTLTLSPAASSTRFGTTLVSNGTISATQIGALGTGTATVSGASSVIELNTGAGTSTHPITVDNGGTFRWVQNAQLTLGQTLNVTGTGGTVFVGGALSTGKVLIGGGLLSSNVGATLTKTGGGDMQLSGANFGYQSDVNVNAGYLEFQNVDSLGTGTQTITVNSGGEFLTTGVNVRHNFTLNSGAILSANGSGAGNYSGIITLGGNATANPRLFQTPTVGAGMGISGTLAGANVLTIAGVNPSLQGAGQTGFSNLYLSGNNASFAGSFNLAPNGRISIAPTATVLPLGSQTVNFTGGTLAVAPDMTPGALGTAGFFGRYYNHAQLSSALIGGFDFGLTTPAATRTDTTINFPNFLTAGLPAGPANTNLGISWAGVLKITTAGAYAFTTSSDDGSMLYVDGSPIAANDTPQGIVTRGGSINLAAGFHSVVIKYAQGGGGTGMSANYSGPDTSNASVLIGSVANTVTSNGTGVLGSATISSPLVLAAGQTGTIEAVGGNVTSSGTLNIGNGATFAVTGETGAELVTQGGAVTLNGRGIISVGGTGQSLAFTSAGADMTISGPIGEAVAGSTILKTGGRTLTLTGTYGWTGSTTLAGGFLALNKPLPSGSPLAIINNGLNNTLNAGVIGSGTYALNNDVNIFGASTGNNTFSGTIDLGTAHSINVWGLGNTLITATITNGDLIKGGLGTMTLNTANAGWTGAVTVNSGKLSVTNVSGLGSAATGTTVNAGGYLDIANISIAEPLTLNGRGQPFVQTTSGVGGLLYTGALQGSGGTAAAETAPIVLGSNTSIGVVKGSALTISNVISDGGSGFSLTKTQGDGTIGGAPATLGAGGTLVLTGASTYTGATNIQAGELRLANAGGLAIASTAVRIGDGSNDATLTLGANNQMPTGVIIDFNNASRNSKFQLNGFNQTVAGFANTLGLIPIIQNFETGGAGTSTLTVNNPTDTSFSGYIRNQSGTLALTKTGAGTFTISGNGQVGTSVGVVYTGATSVNQGKLVFQDLTNTMATPITLSGTGSLEFNEGFGRTTIYPMTLTDGGLGFTKTGLGNLVIGIGGSTTAGGVVSTVTGTINVNAGTLSVWDAPSNLNPIPGAPINVLAGAQLDFFGISTVTTTFNNNITLNGLSNGGALSGSVLGGTPTNTLTGTLTLNATSNISTGWSDKILNINGVISGAPGAGLVVDKLMFTQNPGVINITNTGNSYTGDTTLNSGTVQFTAGALPATGNLKFGGTFGNAGNFGVGQLVLSTTAGTSFTRAIGTGAGQVQFTGDGGGFSAIGAATTVTFGGGTVNWNGSGLGFDANSSFVLNMGTGANNEVNVTNDINLNSGVRRIAVGANQARLSGALSGTSELIVDGGATLIMSGAVANSNTGLVNVSNATVNPAKTGGAIAIAGDVHLGRIGNNGIIILGASEQVADTATLTFVGQSNGNGFFRLGGFTETVANLQDRSGGGVVENFSGTAGTIIVNSSTDSFYNGFFRNGTAGTLALTKNGTGTLTISSGQQSNTVQQTYTGATTINNGTLKLINTESFNSAITVTGVTSNIEFAPTITRTHTYGLVVGGTGNLVKSGLGTLILSGANAYSGTTTVNGGILNVTGTTTVAQTGAYAVNSGGTLLIGNGTTGGVLTNNNAITVNSGGIVAFNRNNAYNFSGVISGAGNVESRAGGTATILSGANTFSGSTTIQVNSSLTLAGNSASAGGLTVNSGGTLTLDFTQAGSSATNLVAATAPVTLNGGTLTLTGSGVANTQGFGTITLGGSLPGGLPGFTPSQPSAAASTINFNAGAGGLTINIAAINHANGGTASITLPASGTVTLGTAAVGGIANGFTTTSGGTTWLAESGGGVLSALAAYTNDTWAAGANIDATITSTQAASSTANSLRFNSPTTPYSVNLSGTNTLTTGGILVTSNVGGTGVSITGGSIQTGIGQDLTVIQNSVGFLSINSNILDNTSGTALTKAGTGTLRLAGTNTYAGGTFVTAGKIQNVGTLGAGTVSVGPNGTLEIGDGTTAGVIPTNIGPMTGTFIVNNPVSTPQTISTAFDANSNYNFLTNSNLNSTTFQTGSFQKNGTGTLTISNALVATTFHPQNGNTVITTGGNVVPSSYTSVGRVGGDIGTLTMNGAGRLTVTGSPGDFNISDLTGSAGTLNITDVANLTVTNMYVGKTGTATGIVNQSGLSTVNVNGSGDTFRMGGAAVAGDSASYGSYKMTSGTLNRNNGTFQPGAYGSGIFTQEGGASSFASWISPARFQNVAIGEMNIQGGTLAATNAGTRLIVGETGTGMLNVGVTNAAATPYSGGQLFLTGGLSSGGATSGTGIGYSNLWYGGLINGATFGDHDAANVTTTSTFNFHGGIVQARQASTAAIPLFGGGSLTNNNGAFTNAYIYGQGANFDTNSFASTVVQPLLAPTGSGLLTIPVTSGGIYQAEPIVQITGGGGTGATARAILTGTAITGFQITNPGVGYTSAPTIALIGGAPFVAGVPGTPTIGANVTTGGLTKLGTGTMTFTSNTGSLGTTIGTASTYGGATTVNGGTLVLDFSGWNQTPTNMVPATSPLVLGGGTLTVNGHASVATAPTGLTGTWAINTNIITLSAANTSVVVGQTITATGIPASAIVTAVNGTGITISANATAAGSAAALTFGTYTTTAASQTFGGVTLNPGGNAINALVNSGVSTTVTLGAITRNAGSAVDFTLPATGNINTLTANTGTSILGGWATVNGGANWAVSAGTGAVAGNISALGSYVNDTWASGNNTTVTTSSTAAAAPTNSLRFNNAGAFTVTLNGASVITTGGILVTSTVGNNASIITGGTSLASGGTNTDLIVNQFNTSNTLAINAVIAANGTGGLVKAGGGVLLLGNVTNTYAGNTVVGAGTLRLNGANNVSIPNGAGKGNLIISAGATFDLNGFDEQINGLSGYGTITNANAASKTITVGDNDQSSTFSGAYLNGAAPSNVLTKIGAGTLTINSVNGLNTTPNTYTGTTNINGGAIKIATPFALSNNTVINVNSANGLLFDVTNPTISGLGGNSNFALQTTGTSVLANTAVQLSVGNNNNSGATFSGALTGTGVLVKIGTGTETLSGANLNTGGLVANAGNLVLSGDNSGAGGSVFINSGGTVQLNAANSLWGASGRTFVVASGGILTPAAFVTNPATAAFGSITPLLARIDTGSTGVLALQSELGVQAPISENLDFSASGQVSLGATLTGTAGFGDSNVQYTGVITPNANTFRLGGGGGRLFMANAASMSGANNLFLYGGGNTSGVLYLSQPYGFTGSTTVNAGVTYISSLANGGSASSIGAGSSAASNLVLNGGTLSYIGSGSSTDRLFTVSAAPTVIDSSGTGPVNFANTGALGFLNGGSRTITLQGQNTGLNTIAASITDSINVAGTSGVLANGLTTVVKNGNGTWVLSGNNTFTGTATNASNNNTSGVGVTINNGVLIFANANSFGGITAAGPASVWVNTGGAAGLGSALTGSLQTSLQRISPLSLGSVALTANSSENLNFDGGAGGAVLPNVYLGAYGNVAYNGTITPFGNTYRFGGGGGVLTLAGGGFTGPRQVVIGGGGPGSSLVNNPNLNGQVILGGTSDYSGGTIINPGAILSATSLTALGTGPLKFQGGFYRAVDATDITLDSGGVNAREIRIGVDAANSPNANNLVNIDVVGGVNLTFSKTFGIPVTLGSNYIGTISSTPQTITFTKYGAGALTLANGVNFGRSDGSNTVATNSGTLIIERGTLSLGANPTNWVGNLQVGSNNGGVGTLKLVANNVFANTVAQYTSANIVDVTNGSKLDLNGFSDTIRQIRASGAIVNTGAGTPTLTTGTVTGENMIWTGNLVGSFILKRAGNIAQQYGTGSANNNGIELWNNLNPNFTGKFIADGGGIRFRADGTLGSASEPVTADKITLNNGGILYASGGAPLVLGANRGITLGSGGGELWSFNSNSLIVNGPISGSGLLTIADDTGAVYLGSDSNTYTGGTMVNSNSSGRGMLVIGAGGATGALPAGDVFLNGSGGTTARIYFFTSSNKTVANNINGGGIVLQTGAGTTTFTGNNTTNLPIWIGGGRYKADFSGGNSPVSAGVNVNINGGDFEYRAPAGDNTERLGSLNLGAFTGQPMNFNGGLIGDSVVQSTYGGSGSQTLIFSALSRAGTGSTLNFVTSGGTNGVTNSIGFTGGIQPNLVLGASFFYGSEFAAYDQNGFVRAVQGTDLNATPDNTVVAGRYLRLTAAQTGQGAVAVPGINLVGSSSGFTLTASSALTLNGGPGTLLKSGGGTAIIGGAAGATVNNNAQELILRSDAVSDILQIDVPIAGTGALVKSGPGQVTLTAANTYTGTTLVNSGTLLVTSNGAINPGATAAEIRIANAAGSTATLTIDSASASISSGTTGNAIRVGEAGNGTLNQSAGTVTAQQYLVIGENLGATGTYNMTGGTMNVKQTNANSPSLVVGRAGVGTLNISGSSAVNIKQGGQFQIASGNVNPGQYQGLVPNSGLSTGVGTVLQTGGTVTVDASNGVYQSNAIGAVIIGVDGTGTYTLNGGTLSTPILARGNGTATFNLGGGTLKSPTPIAAMPNFVLNTALSMNLTGTGAGRGTIDTNGNDMTMTGALSGVGGLKKISTGTLTILGAGSYADGTEIAGGNIVAGGTSLGSGVVNVGAAGTLTVQGVQQGLLARFFNVAHTDANPNVAAINANAAPEFANLDQFNAFVDGKALIAAESTTARGKVSVNYLEGSGNQAFAPALLQIQNGTNPFVAHLGGKFNAAVAGDYTFQTRSDDGNVVWIDGTPVLDNNHSQGQTTRTGTINLTAGLHDIVIGYYQGGGGDGFTVGVTLPTQGQSFTTSGTSELNMSNDLLSYGSSTLTISGLAGSGTAAIGTGTLEVNGAGTNTFSGGLTGSGAGCFLKTGAGTQILSGNNNAFTAGYCINGGTLSVVGSTALGTAGSISFGGGTLQHTATNTADYSARFVTTAGQLYQVDTNSQNVAWASNLTSSGGSLTKLGNGTLTLTGTNTYSAGTTINGGTLNVNANAALGAAAGPLAINNGSTLQASGTVTTAARTVTLGTGGGIIDTNGNAVNLNAGSVVAGTSLTKIGAGTLTMAGVNTYTGGTTITNGTVNINNDAALGNAAGGVAMSNDSTLQAAANVTTNRTITITSVAGANIDTNGSTVTLDTGSTVTGTQLEKVGTGKLNINGTQTYATLTTTAGITNVNTALGTGSSTINANADTNIGASQTLSALNIGAGATVTFGDGPFSFGFDDGGSSFGSAPAVSVPAAFGFSNAAAALSGTASGPGASAVVPEPGSIGLLLVGGLGLLNRRRREKKSDKN